MQTRPHIIHINLYLYGYHAPKKKKKKQKPVLGCQSPDGRLLSTPPLEPKTAVTVTVTLYQNRICVFLAAPRTPHPQATHLRENGDSDSGILVNEVFILFYLSLYLCFSYGYFYLSFSYGRKGHKSIFLAMPFSAASRSQPSRPPALPNTRKQAAVLLLSQISKSNARRQFI